VLRHARIRSAPSPHVPFPCSRSFASSPPHSQGPHSVKVERGVPMFGLSRLLEIAGGVTEWLGGKNSRRLPVYRRRLRRALLLAESLEDRVVPTLMGQQLFPSD